MTHTPGPWTLDYYGDNEIDVYSGDTLVCAMRGGDTDPDEGAASEADAMLIAAAPELLRELKFAVSVLQDNHIARGVAAALAAIRQAEGRTE